MLARGVLGIAVLAAACGGLLRQANAETFVEHSAETRMQLDLVVADCGPEEDAARGLGAGGRDMQARPRTATCA